MLDRQELEKNIDLLSERANKAEQSYFELLERIKEEQKLSYNLREKVLARNTQIADLKHRLEKAESVTSLLCKYGKDTERNKRLSLPHEIFVAIDKALEK